MMEMQRLKEIIAYFLQEKFNHERSYNILIVEHEKTWIAFPGQTLTLQEAKNWINKNQDYPFPMHIIYSK